jgi:AcrR family transcriptional regulator
VARGDTRAKLLEAAGAVIRRDGAQALTLDAVAAQAGVSKGGLLYHFASKRELLDGLVERWLDEFQDDIDAGGPGSCPATCAPPTAPRPRSRACSRR